MFKRVLFLLLLGLCSIVVFVVITSNYRTGYTIKKTIMCKGLNRSYLLHIPRSSQKNKPIPLLFIFHGGDGDGEVIEQLTRFSTLSDREGFIAVYPNGYWKNFNDGREQFVSRAHRENIDDVFFIFTLIEKISEEFSVDQERIFATGLSNGAIFCHYLAAHLSGYIAAIAPVDGGIAERFQDKFKPEKPVSVLIIQGTDDPWMPFRGGGIIQGKFGRIIDTYTAAQLWKKHNDCAGEPLSGSLPDIDISDGCSVKWLSWGKCRGETEVMLYLISGGGHTWPNSIQYLPVKDIGRMSRDFDATAVIWEFFKKHPKKRQALED
jgi:polyhydroxybutyrate depolymerase